MSEIMVITKNFILSSQKLRLNFKWDLVTLGFRRRRNRFACTWRTACACYGGRSSRRGSIWAGTSSASRCWGRSKWGKGNLAPSKRYLKRRFRGRRAPGGCRWARRSRTRKTGRARTDRGGGCWKCSAAFGGSMPQLEEYIYLTKKSLFIDIDSDEMFFRIWSGRSPGTLYLCVYWQ